jgi:alkyldihydroxyacetonephosphate synthase
VPLESRPLLGPALQAWLDLPDAALRQETPPVALETIELREPRLDDPMLTSLRRTLGDGAVRVDDLARVTHSCGKSYADLVRLRAGHVTCPPDAVVLPAGESQVVALLSWCAQRDVAVVPFGGGTGLTGSLQPPEGENPAIALDLSTLDNLISLDEVAQLVAVQAGARGSEIEAVLNARGLTLGGLPSSSEFSTVGGWVAAGAAGHGSVAQLSIEGRVHSVRVVTPAGMLDTENSLSGGAQEGLLGFLFGSEGSMGVITQVTLGAHPVPEERDVRALAFKTLEDALAALREMLQGGRVNPTVAVMWDGAAAAIWDTALPGRGRAGRLGNGLAARRRDKTGYPRDADRVVVVLGFEGAGSSVTRQWRSASAICGRHGATALGQEVARAWEREQAAWPYLRDTLVGCGIMVDLVAAAADWSTLPGLRETLLDALRGAVRTSGGGPGFVCSWLTHLGAHGGCLYAAFLGRQPEEDSVEARVGQWQAVRGAALEAILSGGGRASPSCGGCFSRSRWLELQANPTIVGALRALKDALDPTDVMNPGVLARSSPPL